MKGFRSKSVMSDLIQQIAKQPLSSFSLLKHDTSNPYQMVLKKRGRHGSNLKSHEQNYIVCPIENPYESKINAKKMELNKHNKITGKLLIVLLLFLTISSLVISGFVFLQINVQLNQDLTQQFKNNINVITQYTKLMLAYQGHYKYALLNLHISDLIQLGINPNDQLNETGYLIEAYIKQFQQSYLLSLSNLKQSSYTYNIHFQSFNISTHTTSTNLFDYSSNILLYGDDEALNFLIDNYDGFTQLTTSVFKSLQTIEDNLSYHQNMQVVTCSALIGTSLLFFIISTIINYKIQIIRREIKTIFRLMQKKSMESIFLSFVLIKKKIISLEQSDSYSQKKYQHTINKYLNKTEHQIHKNQHKKQSQEEKKTDNSTKIQGIPNKIEQHQNKHNTKTQQQTKVKQSLRCSTIWVYLLVFISLVGVNIVQVMYFKQRIQMEYEFIQFSIENRLISQHLIKQILQTEQVLLTASLLDVNNYTAQNYVNNVWLVNNKKLPQTYFSQFTSTYFLKISGDLCKILVNFYPVSFSYQECQSVGNGLFSNGLPITIQNTYQSLLNSQKKNSSYWFSRLNGHKFAVYQEIFMAQQMVIAINNEKDLLLVQYIDNFHKIMMERVGYIFLLSCAVSLCLLLMLLKCKCETYKLSSIVIGYFLIIPKKILLENQVLDHIRKKQLLKRISTI